MINAAQAYAYVYGNRCPPVHCIVWYGSIEELIQAVPNE